MSVSCLQKSDRRTVPVRLIDVPLDVRMAGASTAIRQYACDADEALLIMSIAARPDPDLIAWVRP